MRLFPPILVAAVVLAGASGSSASTPFLGVARPQALGVFDLDRDGKLDVTSANAARSSSTLRGDGTGAFFVSSVARVPGHHEALAAADLNHDAVFDVAVGSDEGYVSVLLGRPRSLGAPKRYRISDGTAAAFDVLAADVDEDGNADLLATNFNGDSVAVLRGNGGGSFRLVREIATADEPSAADAGDANGDGHVDLVVTVGDDDLELFLGDGTGDFRSAVVRSQAAETASDAHFVDVDRDGVLDVVVASFFGNGVSVFPGTGDGGLGRRRTFTAGALSDLAAGDVNGDGNVDLVGTSFDSRTMAVLLGDGAGGFTVRRARRRQPAHDAALADVTRDGRLDLVTADGEIGAIGVSRGRGDGTFAPGREFAAGPPACVVPDLVRRPLPEAKRRLYQGGCRVGRLSYRYSRTVARARVVRQSREPATELRAGARVSLVVSRGRRR